MTIYVYDETTRRINFTYDAPYPQGYAELLASHSLSWVQGEPINGIQDLYVNNDGEVKRREEISSLPSKTVIQDNGEDSADWVDLPEGSEIRVDGVLYHTGTSFSLVSDQIGEYIVTISCPFYIDQVTSIKVVA